jgi:hypothetical protein
MATFQSVIDDARVFLKDADKVRYTDANLLTYANDVVRECKRIRPDFFLGSYSSVLSTFVLGDTVPVPIEYHQFLKDFIIGRAEMVDDEYANESRAVALLIRFKNGMTSV